MSVISCFVPHLFCTDMVSHSLLSVAEKCHLGFAELHVRVKIGDILFRCDTTVCYSGCVVIVGKECSVAVAAGNGGHLWLKPLNDKKAQKYNVREMPCRSNKWGKCSGNLGCDTVLLLGDQLLMFRKIAVSHVQCVGPLHPADADTAIFKVSVSSSPVPQQLCCENLKSCDIEEPTVGATAFCGTCNCACYNLVFSCTIHASHFVHLFLLLLWEHCLCVALSYIAVQACAYVLFWVILRYRPVLMCCSELYCGTGLCWFALNLVLFNHGSGISGVIMFCSHNMYCMCVNMVYRLVMNCSKYGFYVDVAAELW
jgi:hypothetical protein